MQITKEAVSVVAVHTHTDNFKYNKNNDFRGDIILPCVFVDTGWQSVAFLAYKKQNKNGGKMMKILNLKNKNGITLIALVIT